MKMREFYRITLKQCITFSALCIWTFKPEFNTERNGNPLAVLKNPLQF